MIPRVCGYQGGVEVLLGGIPSLRPRILQLCRGEEEGMGEGLFSRARGGEHVMCYRNKSFWKLVSIEEILDCICGARATNDGGGEGVLEQ